MKTSPYKVSCVAAACLASVWLAVTPVGDARASEGGEIPQGSSSRSKPSSGPSKPTFDDVLNVRPAGVQAQTLRLTPVREAALMEAAVLLGTQWGLGDRSRELNREMEALAKQLDRRYEFGALMLGVGFLPPVISKAENAVAIEGQVMRVAKAIYVVDEPPRPVRIAPTWRDWLYTGLDPELRPVAPSNNVSLPRDAAESAFWKQQLNRAYAEGRRQADEVFALNMGRLDRTYDGMRRFYDLVKRGMVSAPVIASAASVAQLQDPNTMVVGNIVFTVTVPSRFVDKPDRWEPLAR